MTPTVRCVRVVAGTFRWLAILWLCAVGGLAGGLQQMVLASDPIGSLLVESEPAGASVYVDGRLAGETPLTLPAIAAGVHRVRMVRLGYLENSRLVTVMSGARATLRARLTDPAPQSAQSAALKIVVVDGEGAVNIIQQKTAVAPVIEVRDRNDQPVAGAIVRFAIQKGQASFNGARTVSVTTNAAGRATATGFAATSKGTLQIVASATFQGQTAAATIAQTTVATAAEASSAAASASGATAGGSGLSHTALAAILGGAGAGVAGVALAAKASSDSPSGPPSIFTLRTINGVALPVVILPECQLGGPPCAPCIMTATAGTLTLTPPNEFSITLTTSQTCVDPQGRSPTTAGPTLTNTDTGVWSAQADGTITFRSGGLLNSRSGTQSGSSLTVSFDWLANNPGTANVPVATQWSK